MSYEVNILVNGNRCRQYNHNGQLFVEAKHGSEYSIEIKNNTWQRILAVTSVDGLDALNGKAATENGNGYVINGYGSLKLDGFRVSNETVAKFVFDYKNRSYAASKEDGSERNVGVIGVRIFQEKEKPQPIIIREEHHHHHNRYNDWDYWWDRPYWPWKSPWTTSYTPPPTIWCSNTYSGTAGMGSSDTYTMNSLADSRTNNYHSSKIGARGGVSAPLRSRNATSFNKLSSTGTSAVKGQSLNSSQTLGCIEQTSATPVTVNFCSTVEPGGFDMGTRFGEAKESRVIEVEFEKGILTFTTNIYYASRQSLIEMGVPMGNEKQVSFPEPFKDSKYAIPPRGWKS
jgi:hypothetical protein